MTTEALVALLNAGNNLAEAADQNWDDEYKSAAISRWEAAAEAVRVEMAAGENAAEA